MNRSAEEYREVLSEPEEDLDFPEKELSPRMRELLSDFDAGIDRAIAAANREDNAETERHMAELALTAFQLQPENGTEDEQTEAGVEADPEQVADAELPISLVKAMNGVYNETELTPEHYEKAEKMLQDIDWTAAADFLEKPTFSREPDGSPRHARELIHFATEAANGLKFQSIAERQEFAGHAAKAMAAELADPTLEADPMRQRMRDFLEYGLAVKFAGWHPDWHDPRESIYLLAEEIINGPNLAAGFSPEFLESLDAYDREYAPLRRDPTLFTADRYQNESSLGVTGQALVNGIVAALQDRYPETIGYPGLGTVPHTEAGIKEVNSGYAVEAIWKDLQKAFQSQDFLNEAHFQEEAAAIAYAATDGADPGNPAARHLQVKLADWMADRNMTDEEWGQRAAELQDAAQAAALWQTRRPGEPLDWAALIELKREQNDSFPHTLFLMQTAANYATALQAAGLDETTDLNFGCIWTSASGVEPRYECDPKVAGPVLNAYMGLIRQSYQDNAELITHAAGIKESFIASAESEVKEQREQAYAESFQRLSSLTEDQEKLSGIIAEQIQDGGAAAFPTGRRIGAAEGRKQSMQMAEHGEEIENGALQSRFRQVMALPLRGIENAANWRNPPADARFDHSESELTAMAVILDLDRRWREQQAA